MTSYRIVGGPPLNLDGRIVGFGDEFEADEIDERALARLLDTGQVVDVTPLAPIPTYALSTQDDDGDEED